MEWIALGLFLLTVLWFLSTGTQNVTPNEVAKIKTRQTQKQADSGCGSIVLLGIVLLVIMAIAASGSTALANM